MREWLRGVFAECNQRVSRTITQIPTTYETALDMTFIQHFLGVSAPHRFPSGWVADISTHFLGGGRHYFNWEVADIGVLVIYRQRGKVLRSKIALLQSKRLYPNELEWDEDNDLNYARGFGRLFQQDDDWDAVTAPRNFGFSDQSKYKALVTGVKQYDVIAEYEEKYKIPIYYLLYNPLQIPFSVTLPISGAVDYAPECRVGCRVIPAKDLRGLLASRPLGHSPAFGEICNDLLGPFAEEQHTAGWRLEHFLVDSLLNCETGYIAKSRADAGLDAVFNRRTGPISAAFSITLDAP
ncbi:hypothetical protein ABZW49_00140 [Nonomuraea wenchangensis]